jgi:hypothetical protein
MPFGGTPLSESFIKHSTSCIYFFQGRYRKWAKSIKYDSKLPGDVKKCKAAAELVTAGTDETGRLVVASARVELKA